MRWIFTEAPSVSAGILLEIFPANSSDTAVRVEFFGDEIDRISEIDVLTGEIKCQLAHIGIFPASHYVVPAEQDPEGGNCH